MRKYKFHFRQTIAFIILALITFWLLNSAWIRYFFLFVVNFKFFSIFIDFELKTRKELHLFIMDSSFFAFVKVYLFCLFLFPQLPLYRQWFCLGTLRAFIAFYIFLLGKFALCFVTLNHHICLYFVLMRHNLS